MDVKAKTLHKIPLLDLKRQYRSIKGEIDEALQRIVESQSFILGSEVKQLEERMARYCQSRFAVGVSSGTDALVLHVVPNNKRGFGRLLILAYIPHSANGGVFLIWKICECQPGAISVGINNSHTLGFLPHQLWVGVDQR